MKFDVVNMRFGLTFAVKGFQEEAECADPENRNDAVTGVPRAQFEAAIDAGITTMASAFAAPDGGSPRSATLFVLAAGNATNQQGVLRLLVGVDGVVPLQWGELFAGVEGGAAYTNVAPYHQNPYLFECRDCFGDYRGTRYWGWQPALRVRAGFDAMRFFPLILGADIGYSLLAGASRETHWAEVRGRVGFAF